MPTSPYLRLGHAIADRFGRFLNVDDHFCELIRRERADILHQTILGITAGHDRPLNAELLRRLEEEGRPFVIRKSYLCGDGGQVQVENAVSLVTDGLGSGVVTASVQGLPPAPDVRALAATARMLLAEQAGRALVHAPPPEPGWALLLAAYVLEASGRPCWADEVCATAGQQPGPAGLMRVWELVATGALEVDGASTSLARTSLRLSAAHVARLEAHLATVRAKADG